LSWPTSSTRATRGGGSGQPRAVMAVEAGLAADEVVYGTGTVARKLLPRPATAALHHSSTVGGLGGGTNCVIRNAASRLSRLVSFKRFLGLCPRPSPNVLFRSDEKVKSGVAPIYQARAFDWSGMTHRDLAIETLLVRSLRNFAMTWARALALQTSKLASPGNGIATCNLANLIAARLARPLGSVRCCAVVVEKIVR